MRAVTPSNIPLQPFAQIIILLVIIALNTFQPAMQSLASRQAVAGGR